MSENIVYLSDVAESFGFELKVEDCHVWLVDNLPNRLCFVDCGSLRLTSDLPVHILKRLDEEIKQRADFYREVLSEDITVDHELLDHRSLHELLDILVTEASSNTRDYVGDIRIDRAVANPDSIAIDTWILDAVEEQLGRIAYDNYKVDWMNNHGITLAVTSQLVDEYKEHSLAGDFDGTFEDYIEEFGFHGELWACFEEFMGAEFLDKEYISALMEKTKVQCVDSEISFNEAYAEYFRVLEPFVQQPLFDYAFEHEGYESFEDFMEELEYRGGFCTDGYSGTEEEFFDVRVRNLGFDRLGVQTDAYAIIHLEWDGDCYQVLQIKEFVDGKFVGAHAPRFEGKEASLVDLLADAKTKAGEAKESANEREIEM